MPSQEHSPDRRYKFPLWVRCASFVWFAIWFPVYWRYWGVENFLHVCDITVIVTCAGLFWSSPLLLSSQAAASILTDVLWDLDTGWRLFSGHNLVGGTEYMWDTHYALWVRLLSLFHVAWPILLLCSLRQTGYDRRGLGLQSAIAAVAIIASRFANPSLNINFAFRAPIGNRSWGPAPVHIALMWLGFVLLIYLPTHLLLKKLFPACAARTQET